MKHDRPRPLTSSPQRTATRRTSAPWLAGAVLLLAACGGGGASSGGGASGNDDDGGDDTPPPAVVLTDMKPLENGFAFANFPSSWYADEFVADDLVAMFGSDPSVCIDGVADPCELTAEAAAFARMVNQSRASGHCEGLVVVAQARFNERSDPPTGQLIDESETIKAIMRAFATQFLPEVRDEITGWLESSLKDKVEALQDSLAEGSLTYSLGVYVEGGGHAILPYAIEYLTPTTPRIMVYDSNWPGRNRWVDVDLESETWSFSFSGDDPDNDPDVWTGDATRMDLTSIDSRAGSCPFCDGDVGVAKNALLVRSTDLEWSVEANGETVDAGDAGADDTGVVVTPVKGQAGSGRTSFDYLIELPDSPDGERAKITLPGTASVFALTPSGIAQISTPGNPDIPVEVGATSFVSADPEVTLSLASGNLVATASGPTATLEIVEEGLKAAVTTEDGQTVEVAVTPDTPAAKIVADPEQGGVEVLAQAADGIVEKRDIAADGSETVTIETTPLNLNATSWEAPPGLESAPLPMLPPPDARNVNNPDYAVDTPYTPPADAVPASDTVPPETTAAPATTTAPTTTVPPPTTAPPTTTTQPPPTTTTAPPTTTSTTTTTVPPTTTSTTTTQPPPPPTTTVPPPVTPSLAIPEFATVTFGDGPLTVIVLTNSPAPVSFTSSNPTVAAITSVAGTSAQIGISGAGTTTITVTQSATASYAAATFSRTLTVTKAQQTALTVTNVIGTPGSSLTLSTSGGSGTGGVGFTLTNNGGGSCTLSNGQVSRPTPGTCVVTATKAEDANYQSVSSDPTTVSFVSVIHGSVDEGNSMTLNAPAGMRFSRVLFASYGLPEGTAGNYAINTSCHAENSVTTVSNSALGRSSVTLDAFNEIFGDPCGGIVKRLSVSLEFEEIPAVATTISAAACAPVEPNRGPDHEACGNAYVAGATDVNDKYYEGGSAPFEVWIDLGATYRLSQFALWTANDSEERDPTTFAIFAATGSVLTPASGATPIATGSFSCPMDRFTSCGVATFAATSPVRYIVVRITETRGGTHAGMQLSRGQFEGVASPAL